MKNKKRKSHKNTGMTNKEYDVLGNLWAKYGTEEIMLFLIYLERNAAMEHGAMCHGEGA